MGERERRRSRQCRDDQRKYFITKEVDREGRVLYAPPDGQPSIRFIRGQGGVTINKHVPGIKWIEVIAGGVSELIN